MESRCGILCTTCPTYKDKGCAGCLETETQFWGACPVKACCLGRDLDHCGQCPEIPCDLLRSFAYHETEGDDGERIRTCLAWRREEEKQ